MGLKIDAIDLFLQSCLSEDLRNIKSLAKRQTRDEQRQQQATLTLSPPTQAIIRAQSIADFNCIEHQRSDLQSIRRSRKLVRTGRLVG